MRPQLITFTGPDRYTNAQDLTDLSVYAHECGLNLEIGILLSRHNKENRYPCRRDIERFVNSGCQLSAHLCGSYARDLLVGNPVNMPPLHNFRRVQINFRDDTPVNVPALRYALYHINSAYGKKQFIFQGLGRGLDIVRQLSVLDINLAVFPFFDLSGGRGIHASEWPSIPMDIALMGYAGGLGPDNIAAELPKIADAAHGATFWIDMEGNIRDKKHDRFKIKACQRVLELINAHMHNL